MTDRILFDDCAAASKVWRRIFNLPFPSETRKVRAPRFNLKPSFEEGAWRWIHLNPSRKIEERAMSAHQKLELRMQADPAFEELFVLLERIVPAERAARTGLRFLIPQGHLHRAKVSVHSYDSKRAAAYSTTNLYLREVVREMDLAPTLRLLGLTLEPLGGLEPFSRALGFETGVGGFWEARTKNRPDIAVRLLGADAASVREAAAVQFAALMGIRVLAGRMDAPKSFYDSAGALVQIRRGPSSLLDEPVLVMDGVRTGAGDIDGEAWRRAKAKLADDLAEVLGRDAAGTFLF